jgi:TRAP-type C4-dicarboxylate transport system permease small subunit
LKFWSKSPIYGFFINFFPAKFHEILNSQNNFVIVVFWCFLWKCGTSHLPYVWNFC